MREVVEPWMFVPSRRLVYLNTSNNARQRKPSTIERTNAHESDNHMHESSQLNSHFMPSIHQHNMSHNSTTDRANRSDKALDEFDEIDYALMRENIEKMKRIRIMKQVKSVFQDMFTRVQDITDGLKIQVDEALKEHRKANRMFNKLHNHITNVQQVIQTRDAGERFHDDRNDLEVESIRGRYSPNKLAIQKIESANSSRAASLPDVFKIQSSNRSSVVEGFSSSKTNNIRKIAVKKSHEKSLRESNQRSRKKYIERMGEDETLEARNDSMKGHTDSLKHTDEHTTSHTRRKHKQNGNTANHSSESSGTDCHVIEKKNNKRKSATRPKGRISSDSLAGSAICLVSQDAKELFTSKGKLPKLKREQIAQKIKSIEDCILKPNKLRERSAKHEWDKDLRTDK